MNWLYSLLKDYETGCGYRYGDILTPRGDTSEAAFRGAYLGVRENKVVVLGQSVLCPHMYTVVGENVSPRTPSDRFVKFEIDGHDWKRI